MKIYIIDKNETREIALKAWDGSNWGPDCFDGLEVNVPNDFPIDYEDSVEHDAVAAMTDADYADLVGWWKDEVGKYNRHDPDRSNWFVENLSWDERVEEYAKGIEYAVFAD